MARDRDHVPASAFPGGAGSYRGASRGSSRVRVRVRVRGRVRGRARGRGSYVRSHSGPSRAVFYRGRGAGVNRQTSSGNPAS